MKRLCGSRRSPIHTGMKKCHPQNRHSLHTTLTINKAFHQVSALHYRNYPKYFPCSFSLLTRSTSSLLLSSFRSTQFRFPLSQFATVSHTNPSHSCPKKRMSVLDNSEHHRRFSTQQDLPRPTVQIYAERTALGPRPRSKLSEAELLTLPRNQLRDCFAIKPVRNYWILNYVPKLYFKFYSRDPRTVLLREANRTEEDCIQIANYCQNGETRSLNVLKYYFLLQTRMRSRTVFKTVISDLFKKPRSSEHRAEILECLHEYKTSLKKKDLEFSLHHFIFNFLVWNLLSGHTLNLNTMKVMAPIFGVLLELVPVPGEIGFHTFAAQEFHASEVTTIAAIITVLMIGTLLASIPAFFVVGFLLKDRISYLKYDDKALQKKPPLDQYDVIVALGERGISSSIFTPIQNRKNLEEWIKPSHRGLLDQLLNRIINMEQKRKI